MSNSVAHQGLGLLPSSCSAIISYHGCSLIVSRWLQRSIAFLCSIMERKNSVSFSVPSLSFPLPSLPLSFWRVFLKGKKFFYEHLLQIALLSHGPQLGRSSFKTNLDRRKRASMVDLGGAWMNLSFF